MRWRRSHHLVAVFVVLPFLFSEESNEGKRKRVRGRRERMKSEV
jgi:hypothetical protein